MAFVLQAGVQSLKFWLGPQSSHSVPITRNAPTTTTPTTPTTPTDTTPYSVAPVSSVPSSVPPVSSVPSSVIHPSFIDIIDCGTRVDGIPGSRKCFFAVLVKVFGLSTLLEAFYILKGHEIFKGETYFTVTEKTHCEFAIRLSEILDASFAIYVKYEDGWTRSPPVTFGKGAKLIKMGLFPGTDKVIGHFVHIKDSDNLLSLPGLDRSTSLQSDILAFVKNTESEKHVSVSNNSRFDEAIAKKLETDPNLDIEKFRLELETEEAEKVVKAAEEAEAVEAIKAAEEAEAKKAKLLDAYFEQQLQLDPDADIDQILARCAKYYTENNL